MLGGNLGSLLYGNVAVMQSINRFQTVKCEVYQQQQLVYPNTSHSLEIYTPAFDLLSSSYSKYFWKRVVRNAVDKYCKITGEAEKHRLNIRSFVPGKSYPLLNVITEFTREASRIHARLMVATGTYVLQTNRATCNQNDFDVTSLLSGDDDETLSHFLLEYSALKETRHPILLEVLNDRDDVQRHIGPYGTELGLI